MKCKCIQILVNSTEVMAFSYPPPSESITPILKQQYIELFEKGFPSMEEYNSMKQQSNK